MTTLPPSPIIPPTITGRMLAAFEPLFFSGSLPHDSEDTRLRKAQLMAGSLFILPIAIVWAIVYAVFGEWPAALITFTYVLADLTAILILNRRGRAGPLGFVHQFCTLLLPFVLTIVLGGLAQSSALIIGALMAPLGALLYYADRRVANRLFLGYIVLLALSGIINPAVAHDNNLPLWFILALFVLNVGIVSSLAFFQMRAFVRQRDEALRMLRVEQLKTDTLLGNILPRAIADVLKNETQTIAERHEAASILFAAVVDFTRLLTTVEAAEMVQLLNVIYTYFDVAV